MTGDPRQIVRQGYNAAAGEYADWVEKRVSSEARARYLEAFCAMVSAGSTVLELGCGGAGPTTVRLAGQFVYTGIDVSRSQVELARARLPGATFIEADMMQYEIAKSSIDGAVAFYSLIHLPQGELPGMLARIAGWLRPHGAFVACFGARGTGEHIEPTWLAGAPMYWSGYTPEETVRFIDGAGLSIVESSIESDFEDGEETPFLWVLARKPRPQPRRYAAFDSGAGRR